MKSRDLLKTLNLLELAVSFSKTAHPLFKTSSSFAFYFSSFHSSTESLIMLYLLHQQVTPFCYLNTGISQGSSASILSSLYLLMQDYLMIHMNATINSINQNPQVCIFSPGQSSEYRRHVSKWLLYQNIPLYLRLSLFKTEFLIFPLKPVSPPVFPYHNESSFTQ